MKIALAQINPTVGDFAGNTEKIKAFARNASRQGAELVLFPELAVCGYPPADLLEKPSFLARAQKAVEEIAREVTRDGSLTVICGTVTQAEEPLGKQVMNTAAVLCGGEIAGVQHKRLLPFYDVFDEQRYFAPAREERVFEIGGQRVALTICEDAWNDKGYWPQRRYSIDPVEEQMRQGASLILNISASPFWQGKRELRREMLGALAKTYKVPVLMVNQVGGNDSLIFDGTSTAHDSSGALLGQAKSFAEDLLIVETESSSSGAVCGPACVLSPVVEATYDALVLGTRDYVRKCGFSQALIGLSGGIDSALVAAIAVDALGRENVMAVGMPSPYSSEGSISDSRALAANLGIRFEVLPIDGVFSAFCHTLQPLFAGRDADITEENMQSRTRGTLLMALSNKLGALVLTTGNKSEMATGYSTLYGDMVGALAVIGDVVKTQVYALARYVNREREVIPQTILDKAPSAELRPGQRDTDSLPQYEVLDPIVEAYVERYETAESIACEQKVDVEVVRRVIGLIERSEYKRQQAAPVLKVTAKSFGSGRRFPIAVKVQI